MSLLVNNLSSVIFELNYIPEYIHSDTQYPFQPKFDSLFIPSMLFIQIMENIYKIKSTRTKKCISTNGILSFLTFVIKKYIKKTCVLIFLYTMVTNAC